MTNTYKSPKEVAKELNLSEQTVWRWLRAGKIPGAVKFPSGAWRIPEDYIHRITSSDILTAAQL